MNRGAWQPGDLEARRFFPVLPVLPGETAGRGGQRHLAGHSPHNAWPSWPYTCRTDRDGQGAVRMLQPGVWVIKANHKAPYPNPEEADEYSLTATLTFEVR